jgi:hypothetical protein
MPTDRPGSRRQFLRLAGTTALAATLAGCGGGDGGDTDTEPVDTTEGVPDAYATATAQGGAQRDPANVVAGSQLSYQTEPNDGERCDGCQFYITDKDGDGMGACTLVAGPIDPAGWCTSYAAYEPGTTTE